jgi:hypothetical protein
LDLKVSPRCFNGQSRRWRADEEYAVKSGTTKALANVADEKFFDNWFDPIETALRTNVCGFIETMMEEANKTAKSLFRAGPPNLPDGGPIIEMGAVERSRQASAIGKENPGS